MVSQSFEIGSVIAALEQLAPEKVIDGHRSIKPNATYVVPKNTRATVVGYDSNDKIVVKCHGCTFVTSPALWTL